MKKILALTVSAATAAFASAPAAFAADAVRYQETAPVYQDAGARNGVKLGYLACDIGGGVGYVLGSAKEVSCVFTSTDGDRSDAYVGSLRKMGIDLGFTTRGKMVWAVFAPTAGYHAGSLGGLYQGATAEATVGAGIGANILIGGTSGSIHLQTVSVQGQLGLNIAATGTSMTLTPAS
jgi:opacity protein-like surface antigen